MDGLFDWFIGSYHDPRLLPVTVYTVLVGMAAFALFAGGYTWLSVRDPVWARRYKIQNTRGAGTLSEEEAEKRNILIPGKRMVRLSLKSWIINNAWMIAGTVSAWPLMSLSGVHLGPLPPLWVIAWQLVFFIYLDDFLYYWMHRGMHTRFLLKHVHGWHHRVLTPWAITGHYMHPLEYVLTGTLAFIGPAIVGAHVVTLWIWIIFRQWEGSEGHCGYALPWSPTRFLPFSHGALHHDFHHARVRGNYAGFLPLWDRLFGTYVRDYEKSIGEWSAHRCKRRVHP